MGQNDKLTEVIAAFNEWRSTRVKQCKIPEELWVLAIGLLTWYKPTLICKSLGLNQNDFNRRADVGEKKIYRARKSIVKCDPHNSGPPRGGIKFLELGIGLNPQSYQAVIDKPSGNRLSFKLPPHDLAGLSTLVQAFLGN